MSDKKPRPYQTKAIEQFLATPTPHRLFFAHEMGAGKTLTALWSAKKLNVQNILVICPAIVRPMWARELGKMFGEDLVGSIRVSPNARLTETASYERAAAYHKPHQVTSYELAPFIRSEPWDFIIIDEVHNLRSSISKQSVTVRRIIHANPNAHALGLSGTLIPNEAKQLWSPVDTFWPGMWGPPKASGSGSWKFESEFCNREESSHGVNFHGLREDRRQRLEAKLAPLCSRVVQADFVQYLPPLHVEPLYTDHLADPAETALKWFADAKGSTAHIGIYCHLRETARKIYAALAGKDIALPATLITGETSVTRRDFYLERARHSDRSVIIGTTHALNEGVSLSFQKAALVCEWTTSVDQTLQFIGRFARQDSVQQAPTFVYYLVGPNDVTRADRIKARITAINSVLKAGEAERRAENLFRSYEMSEETFASEVNRICVGVAKRGVLWDGDDTEDDDD